MKKVTKAQYQKFIKFYGYENFAKDFLKAEGMSAADIKAELDDNDDSPPLYTQYSDLAAIYSLPPLTVNGVEAYLIPMPSKTQEKSGTHIFTYFLNAKLNQKNDNGLAVAALFVKKDADSPAAVIEVINDRAELYILE